MADYYVDEYGNITKKKKKGVEEGAKGVGAKVQSVAGALANTQAKAAQSVNTTVQRLGGTVAKNSPTATQTTTQTTTGKTGTKTTTSNSGTKRTAADTSGTKRTTSKTGVKTTTGNSGTKRTTSKTGTKTAAGTKKNSQKKTTEKKAASEKSGADKKAVSAEQAYISAKRKYDEAKAAYDKHMEKSWDDEWLNAISRGEVSEAEQKAYHDRQKALFDACEKANAEFEVAYEAYTGISAGIELVQEGAFKDGVTLGNLYKGSAATAADGLLGLLRGAGGMVEGVADLGGYAVAGIANLVGLDEVGDTVKEFSKKNMTHQLTKDAVEYLDQYSFLGDSLDHSVEGVGQAGTVVVVGAIGSALGLSAKAVSVLVNLFSGASSMGSAMSEAYANGATDKEAVAYGLICCASDVVSEMFFGGVTKAIDAVGYSKGLLSVDDYVADKASRMFRSEFMQRLTKWGVKRGFEGLEGVIASLGHVVGKKFTYMSEWEWSDLVRNENLLEQFVADAVTTAFLQFGGSIQGNEAVSKTDISQSLQDKGYPSADADKIAEVIETMANGEQLSEKQQQLWPFVRQEPEVQATLEDVIQKLLGEENGGSEKTGSTDGSGSVAVTQTDISKSLQNAGFTKADADKIAPVIEALASGKQLTEKQQQLWEFVKAEPEVQTALEEAKQAYNTLEKNGDQRYNTAEDIDVTSLSLRFLSNRDDLYKNIENVPPLEGYEDVVCHADAFSFGFVDPVSGETAQVANAKQLAKLIRETGKYQGRPIRLIACEAGALDSGLAQQFANEMGVPVLAPTKTVYVDSQGYMVLADDDGEAFALLSEAEGKWNPDGWKVFYPKEE